MSLYLRSASIDFALMSNTEDVKGDRLGVSGGAAVLTDADSSGGGIRLNMPSTTASRYPEPAIGFMRFNGSAPPEISAGRLVEIDELLSERFWECQSPRSLSTSTLP